MTCVRQSVRLRSTPPHCLRENHTDDASVVEWVPMIRAVYNAATDYRHDSVWYRRRKRREPENRLISDPD